MGLKFTSREFFQVESEVKQGIKDQAPKTDAVVKSSSKQMTSISGSFYPMNTNKPAKISYDSKLKNAEESLRTVSASLVYYLKEFLSGNVINAQVLFSTAHDLDCSDLLHQGYKN
ncbi:hypothetical protein QQP08_007987 [Theobroma cacao]|nr:hypothetical protein QQP08_007987 [Theobroma cacao]